MMRVLLVHNHYGSGAPSGENRVFELELALLRRKGHDVLTFERHSDVILNRGKIGLITGALTTPWNPAAARAMREMVARFQPHIVHAHNTFPLISPAIFPSARGSARVLTLHNYRLFCAAAIPMRGGETCTDCLDKRSVGPALQYGCYRGSRAATLPLAANIALHRAKGTWHREVEAFVALSSFQRGKMIEGGLPAGRIAVKPNFYAGLPVRIPFGERPERVIYVGRLSAEKGVNDLLEAWIKWGSVAPELRIVGDGPLRDQLELRANTAGVRNIQFLGVLDSAATQVEISRARLLLLPSRCLETFGMSVMEAFAHGVGVGVSDIGSLPGLVNEADGLIFPPGDPIGLWKAVENAWLRPNLLEEMSRKSAAVFEKYYTEEENYRQLVDIYSSAIRERTRSISPLA